MSPDALPDWERSVGEPIDWTVPLPHDDGLA
jgi:hypothetical protein